MNNGNTTVKRKALGGIGTNTGQTTNISINNSIPTSSTTSTVLPSSASTPTTENDNDIEYISPSAFETIPNKIQASDCGFTTPMKKGDIFHTHHILLSTSTLSPYYKQIVQQININNETNEDIEIQYKVPQENVRSVLSKNNVLNTSLDNNESLYTNDDNNIHNSESFLFSTEDQDTINPVEIITMIDTIGNNIVL